MSPDRPIETPMQDPLAGSSILTKTTHADRGIVERPLLTPHLDFRRVGNDNVLLTSETFNTSFGGPCIGDLVPLLDGKRSRQDIVAALADRHSAIHVQTTLVSLASKGYVVSGEFSLDREFAAFWSALGVSPRWAAARLDSAAVSVASDDGRMARHLARLGISVTGDVEPAVHIIVCDDYLDTAHAATNRDRMASGIAWTLVKGVGTNSLFGPVFRPSHGGPCWECLAHRLRRNHEVDWFLRRVSLGGAGIKAIPTPQSLIDLAQGIAAVEIAKWIVLTEAATIHDRAVSFDGLGLRTTQHRIIRRPQCRACGDEELYRPDRPSAPISLKPSPKPIRNSGGVRAVSPRTTLRRYRHLLSPVGGVVTALGRRTEEFDPWLHVYGAESNHVAWGATNLHSLRHSLHGKSSGKGSTRSQSEASAFCEAVERCSGAYTGDEIRRRRRFSDHAREPVMDVIHPNEVMLYSDRQYESQRDLKAPGEFSFVPSPFDPDAEIDWTPVWSLTKGRCRYLPTNLLYYSAPSVSGTVFCRADSNGCASGNSLEEAILQGFFELVERDAFAIWWYNRLSRPAVDLDSFDDPYLHRARGYYRRLHREIWVLDVTSDLGIPVFVSVSVRTDSVTEDIIYAAGAHFDPHIALLRAVCELNQCLCAFMERDNVTGHRTRIELAYDWWREHARIADQAYLLPDLDSVPRRRADYAVIETEDVKEDIERCVGLVESKGLEFLVLDQTRPDIGMPVARVIVPGMRHFWPRFASGRLYDVPVGMGWLEAPNSEDGLNPCAVIL